MTQLSMSEFLVNKTIEELNTDFYDLALNEELEIVTDGMIISLNQSGLATSDTMLSYYLSQALKFEMLKECFFEQLTSLYDFATEHFLSRNPTYNEFKKFKLVLKEYDIDVTKRFHLIGDERKLREFLFLLFMEVPPLDGAPFSKENGEKQQLFDRFDAAPWVKAQQSNRMRLRRNQYIGIVVTRVLNGHLLPTFDAHDLTLPVQERILDEITSWLSSLVPKIPKVDLLPEAKVLLQFLIVEGWLVDNVTYINQDQADIKRFNHEFFSAVEQRFQLSSTIQYGLLNEVTNIHYQLLTIPFRLKYEYQQMDVTYFLEVYPEFTAFCRQYIEEHRSCQVIWENKEFLFFRYLILLVSHVPLKEILAPLYICVDFSHGPFYNRMIESNIEKILDLNMEFQDSPDDKTQLILSNLTYYESVAIDHILWLAPPRPADWANFSEKVGSIRREQFQRDSSKKQRMPSHP